MRKDGQDIKNYMQELFNKTAETYGGVLPLFQEFAEKMVKWASIPVGAHVLDLATGRGAMLKPLLERIGSGGHIIAVDLSSEMVERTKADVAKAGWQNVKVREMNAEQLDFPDNSFDVITSGFALHLVPDSQKAFREIARVLKPGGLLVFSVIGPVEDSGRWEFWHRLRAEYNLFQANREQWRSVDSFNPRDALVEAGFKEIKSVNAEVHIPAKSPRQIWNYEMSHGMRGFIDSLPAEKQAEFKKKVLVGLEEMKRREGCITLDRGATFFKGRKSV